MANFQDFFQPSQSTPLEWKLGEYNIDESNSREDAALAQQRMGTQFGRNMTDLVNRYSARGTVRGGQAGVRADQQREDYDYGRADTSRLLNRHLGDLSRARIMSTLGVTI